MKNKLLCLLFVLCCFPPIISTAAVTTTLEVQFAFSGSANQDQQLLGYRLYKEGKQVCQTNDPSAAKISCSLTTDPGTFNFTLTAYYANGSESPSSPAFPFSISATTSPPPTAVLSSSNSVGKAPLAVSFDGSSSTTLNPPIVSYTWAFGDGSQATGKTTSHSFTTAGTYYTSLTVVDSKGLTNSVNTPIIVTSTAQTNQTPKAVISTDKSAGDAPLNISFDGSKSTDSDGSIVKYSWNFGDGTTGSGKTAQHIFTNKGIYTVSLLVTDDKGGTATATSKITCNTTLPASAFNIEVGEVSIDHNWVKVAFENTFAQPIVVAGPPTTNGAQPVLVRIRNIDQKGFEVRLQEWDYLDGSHTKETFSYIVVEKGTFTLNNGTKIEAGKFTGSNSFQNIDLQQTYTSPPVILSQVITENETDAVTGRIANVGQTSFDYMLQEQEKNSTSHITETIGYIAWEAGQGEFGNMIYEARATTNSINHAWKEITFQTKFPDLPFFIAGMQTTNGGDTAAVRTQNMSQTKTQVKIEEEQSNDSEVTHINEVIGYLAISAKTAGTVQPVTPSTPPTEDTTAPPSIVFSDDFSTDTTKDYTITHPWTKGGTGKFLYDPSGKKVHVLTGDNVSLNFAHTVPSSNTGIFRIDFLPTTFYPYQGKIAITLAQDANNYYRIFNTDGSAPGEVVKFIGGVEVDKVSFQREYNQNNNYNIAITFSPNETIIEAFGETIVLSANNKPISVSSFAVVTEQQDAYYDNMIYADAIE